MRFQPQQQLRWRKSKTDLTQVAKQLDDSVANTTGDLREA